LVRQLEVAAEEGELQHATEFQEQARHRLKHNIGLSRAQMAAIEERLQACAGRLGELRDWRRWGAHQAREQLCATAETLIGLEAEPTEIAQRIQQARDAWKDLDHHEGAAPKALWKRFNHACERAYAPCQAFFEAQNRERRQNLEKKQAICDQLEQFETATDWEQVDWREADRLRRRAQEQWYKSGPVNRTDRKTLDRRFQQVLQRLDERLGAERDHELQRRQQLIQRGSGASRIAPTCAPPSKPPRKRRPNGIPPCRLRPGRNRCCGRNFAPLATRCLLAVTLSSRPMMPSGKVISNASGSCARKLRPWLQPPILNNWIRHAPGCMPPSRSGKRLDRYPKTEQRSLDQRFETAMRQFDQQEQTLRRTESGIPLRICTSAPGYAPGWKPCSPQRRRRNCHL
jgi:exonuclease SbcC